MKRKNYIPLLIVSALTMLFRCEIQKPDPPKSDDDEFTNLIYMDDPLEQGTGYTNISLKTSIYKQDFQNISDHGYCWSSIDENPNKNHQYKSLGTYTPGDDASFEYEITDLDPGTTYYIRAYVQYVETIIFSPQVMITTTQADLPEVTTLNVSEENLTSAKCGGTISSDGGNEILQRGVCWSTTSGGMSPTNPQHTKDGGGTGTFTSSITNLLPGTEYYVRAYATNAIGTTLGLPERSFETTSKPLEYPEVTTNNLVDRITSVSARSGGEVLSEGSSTVYQRGLCYSTNYNLSIDKNEYTVSGSGIGPFTSTINELEKNKQYYFCAYATNNDELTGYGEIREFKTLAQKKVLFCSDQDLSLPTSYERNIYIAINNNPDFVISHIVTQNEFQGMNQSSDFAAYDIVVICETIGSGSCLNYGFGGANFPKPTLCLKAYVIDDWFGASLVHVGFYKDNNDVENAGKLLVKNPSHPIWQRNSISGGTVLTWVTAINNEHGNAVVSHMALDSLSPPNSNITNSSTLLASNVLITDRGIENNGFLWAIEANDACQSRMVIWGIHQTLMQYTTTTFFDIIMSSMYWLGDIE